MVEAQAHGKSGMLLDMQGTNSETPDIVAIKAELSERFKDTPHIDEDSLVSPDPDEIVGALRGNRARANRILLAV